MFKTLLHQVRQFRTASVLTPVFTAGEVVMGVLIPYVTAWIIDRGIMAGDIHGVVRYGMMLLGLAAVSFTFGMLSARFGAIASSGFAYNLREAMFRNIQTFSFSNIDRFSTAGLVTRMTTDVSNLQRAFQQILRISVRAPLNLVFSILMCVWINEKMSLIFVVALVVLGTLIALIMSRTVRLFAQVFERYDELNNSVQENVAAIRVVKAFVREDFEKKKFSRAVQGLYRLYVRTESLMALNHPVMNLVVYGCIIALSWLGAHYIVAGTLTTGELTSMFTYVMTILNSLMMLSMIFVQLTMSAASGRRVAEVIEEKADITSPSDAVTDLRDGSIEFNHVSFAYQAPSAADSDKAEEMKNVKYAIRDISLSIRSGETIGIIGGTGSGKSSMANLISRLYDATQGTVKVGGTDVRKFDLNVLRNSVSMVLQKNVLFSGTVMSNLLWGKEDATPEECREACRIACADEFIDQMEAGYNAPVEQNGSNLSGGQKQRLCIARALLKKPKILILDDSTSACDTATDAKIRVALRNALPDVTKIIIAQRILSVQDADRIIVMQSGRITGFDTHENLLGNNELYQDIYRIQTENNEDADFDK